MKKILYIAITALFFSGLVSCEKNDPLAEQGELTGVEMPSVVLSQMPATAVGDTIELSTTTWSRVDNISKLEYFHKGYTGFTLTVKWTTEVPQDDADPLVYSFYETTHGDSVFIEEEKINSFSDLNPWYQTIMNAYVIKQDFIVPDAYAIQSVDDKDVLTYMESNYFNALKDSFAMRFDKIIGEHLFPETADDTTLYARVKEAVSEGSTDSVLVFNNKLTDLGRNYVADNLTKDMIKNRFESSVKNAFAEVTVLSKVTLNTDAVNEDEKSFEVLETE